MNAKGLKSHNKGFKSPISLTKEFLVISKQSKGGIRTTSTKQYIDIIYYRNNWLSGNSPESSDGLRKHQWHLTGNRWICLGGRQCVAEAFKHKDLRQAGVNWWQFKHWLRTVNTPKMPGHCHSPTSRLHCNSQLSGRWEWRFTTRDCHG